MSSPTLYTCYQCHLTDTHGHSWYDGQRYPKEEAARAHAEELVTIPSSIWIVQVMARGFEVTPRTSRVVATYQRQNPMVVD